ncbi:hypothetical protein KC19_1G288600 [Ceratodon purpureus]|uniref:Uncharacterized protein n=1 Tax=Ceratodon purpureus TaxID=3225 RepID=A0A8T0JC61_CERPU|nr:hypothetical protein KC19_1G288600 [Ceratodon purpureus]
MTALPLIGFLQLSVLLVIALEVVYRRYRHSKDMKKLEMSSQKLRVMAERWMNGSWKNTWMDWVHLCLLSIIGNGLIEAVGRTDPYSWQAKTFQRYSIVYLALSVILWVSSFLHQVTHWIAVDKKESKKWNKATSVSTEPEPASVEDGAAPEAPTLQHSDPASETSVQIDQKTESNTSRAPNISSERETFDPASVARLRKLLGPVLGLEKNNARKKDPVAQLRKLLELGPDWKWQPIAAQTAILFCLWAFLTYPTDENDNLGSTLLGFLVQAASPWSGLYAGRVLFLTLPFLLKKIFNVHHIRHLPKHLLHRYRNRKQATPESKAAKKLPEWLQWGPVLYCVGCFSSEPAPPKKIQASESSSSSGSDSDSDV